MWLQIKSFSSLYWFIGGLYNENEKRDIWQSDILGSREVYDNALLKTPEDNCKVAFGVLSVEYPNICAALLEKGIEEEHQKLVQFTGFINRLTEHCNFRNTVRMKKVTLIRQLKK